MGLLLMLLVWACVGGVNAAVAMVLAQWMAWQWAVLLATGPVFYGALLAAGVAHREAEGE